MKVVSWNMRRATQRRTNAWNYLAELDPDLAFLQEVNSFPDGFTVNYRILHQKPVSKNGRPQMFGTAIIVKGSVVEEKRCSTEWGWVNEELARFEGCFVAARVELSAGPCLQVMSVHSPAWPVDRERLKNIDTTGVQLTQNRDVWGTELL